MTNATPSNLDLIALLTRSLTERPEAWARRKNAFLTVFSAELRIGLMALGPGRFRVAVADGDDTGQTTIDLGLGPLSDEEKVAIAGLDAALEPWRVEASSVARQTALDRLNRQFGDEAPARKAAAERLTARKHLRVDPQ